MTIDITPYRHYKEILIEKYNSNGESRAVEIGTLSSVPVIAIYTYFNEEFGGFDEKIQKVIDFYGYTEIIK